VDVDPKAVLMAARQLMLAGQWEVARGLLTAARPGRPAARAAVAVAQAQLEVDLRQWRAEGDPAAALERAACLVAAAAGQDDDQELGFELAVLRLFSDYWAELMPADGRVPGFGPDGRDPEVLAELRARSARLAASAPAAGLAARAAFFAGLVADNLCAEPGPAREYFTEALRLSRPGADDAVAAEALRHLGGQAEEAGRLAEAREQWERSAALAERGGSVLLALAQQALLAQLAAGQDAAAAGLLATETARWATALNLPRLAAQATAVSPAERDRGQPR
jgi:tetratricopeptide (TPR) repeat protein